MNVHKNQVSRKIDITDKIAEYDENVKYLLSEKIILAHILVYAVKEYAGMKPEDVVELIEGTPQVAKLAVNPGESNMPEIIGVFCKYFLHKVAKSFCRLLHLHFVGNCKTPASPV